MQSYVQQQGRRPRDGGDNRGDGRTDHPFDLFDRVHAADHHRPGAARTGEAVYLFAEQVAETDRDARIRLLGERLSRMVTHFDDLRGVYRFEGVCG